MKPNLLFIKNKYFILSLWNEYYHLLTSKNGKRFTFIQIEVEIKTITNKFKLKVVLIGIGIAFYI